MSTNPISTGIPTNKLYRGRLPEIYTEFIIYTRFISESVFYTQSVMLSPRFIPESVFYNQSVVRSPQFTVRSPCFILTSHVQHRMNFVRIIEWIMFVIAWIILELSNEFCLNHRMNNVWIIEWILFESSNEYCLRCFTNVGENRMRIRANLSNFATTLSNVLAKWNIFEFYCQYVEITKRI